MNEAWIEFISGSKNESFFLYIAHEAPHGPFQGRNDPPVRRVGPDFRIQGPKVDVKRAYKEMIEVMDEGIGKIMDCLRENQLLDNTLIFFCSDNGAAQLGSNLPLRGYKASLWEGGHRVPAIAFWEGQIPVGENDNTLVSMDIFPTLIDVCGKGEGIDPDFDGLSFAKVLSSDFRGDELDNREIFWRYGARKALRKGKWKMVIEGENKFLFDLENDLEEQDNLIDHNPDIVRTMLASIEIWEDEMSEYQLRSK